MGLLPSDPGFGEKFKNGTWPISARQSSLQELIPDVAWVNKDSSHVVTQVVGSTFKTKVDVN